jgi:hypothetical protein
MSGWLRENPEFEISSGNIDQLSQLPSPSFHEQADKLLLAMEKDSSYAGDNVEKTPAWLSQAWCVNEEELNEIINFLRTTNRIKDNGVPNRLFAKIAPEGWAHLETVKRRAPDSTQCFVAMWFAEEMTEVYNNIIAPAILAAGYKPHRVDQREHNEKIDDEIIAQIRQSRFILADFTGHRGGVYFEAGFAKGLNLEVIWTCREDDLENLHFDIRQYNCITWSQANLIDFKTKIKNRIEAVLGHGTYQRIIA